MERVDLPVKGAGAVEELEVEGCGCLAVEFAILAGLHCHCGCRYDLQCRESIERHLLAIASIITRLVVITHRCW